MEKESQRNRLEDMKYELSEIIQNWSLRENRRSKISYEPISALRDMHRLLGLLDEPKPALKGMRKVLGSLDFKAFG